METYHG